MTNVVGKRWSRGDVVVVRYASEDRMTRVFLQARPDSRPNIVGWPYLVLEDTAENLVLYMPEGTPLMRWFAGEPEPRSRPSIGHSIFVFFPDRRYMVNLLYAGPSGGRAPWVEEHFPGAAAVGTFHGWKVDFQSPYGRLEQGIDMVDEILDLAVSPDGTIRWMDEDEMARAVAGGICTTVEADEWRQVGHDAIADIERGMGPFTEQWKLWTPPTDIQLGSIPDGWQNWTLAAPYKVYGPWSGQTFP